MGLGFGRFHMFRGCSLQKAMSGRLKGLDKHPRASTTFFNTGKHNPERLQLRAEALLLAMKPYSRTEASSLNKQLDRSSPSDPDVKRGNY